MAAIRGPFSPGQMADQTSMRVMQICTNFLPGGIQRHVLDLTQDLRGRGHKIVLAGDQGDWSADGADPDFVPVALNNVAGVGGSLYRRVSALPACALTVRKAIRAHGIELIHAHETAPAIVARLATTGMDIPIAMTFHGAAPAREAGVARTARLCAELTISPSRTALDALIAHGLPRAKARTIGLGIHPLPDVPEAEAQALRKRIMGGKEGVLILSLSRLQPQKGIDVMIEVARRVVARRPDVVFAIAGKGPLADAAAGWARDAGVADNVKFLGAISTVPQHLKASDIFLLTSRWENLPISIVEAFRAGLPVVATDCGGVKELVDGEVGALLAVEDARAIAAAVLELVENPGLRRARGAAALARSLEHRFRPATVHDEFERTYEQLIGPKSLRKPAKLLE